MRIGVIGYGTRIKDVLNAIKKVDNTCEVGAIVDIRNDEIKKELQAKGVDTGQINFFESVEEMLSECKVDGICIGTRCHLHTEYALKILPTGIPLFLEKPVATNMDDLIRLRDAGKVSKSPVVVSFPLRVTPFVQLTKEMVELGKIGTVEHVQAVNDVSYGGVYYHNWYRDEKSTGGLFLQKATHDFDYINYVLGIKPVRICAVKSKQIFKGNKPAGLKCSGCMERETCAESTYGLEYAENKVVLGDYCAFAQDTGNEDSGSAIIEYETGMHTVYSQNFFVRNQAGLRGARFIGYKGTIQFDWYSNEFKVYMHHTPRVETHKIDIDERGHGGGDFELAGNFIKLMKGETSISVSPLEDAILSVLICLKAKESAETGSFRDIHF